MTGLEIRELRKKKGWTQAQLARALGTDPVTVSRWERGVSRPRPSGIKRLAALLGEPDPTFRVSDEDKRRMAILARDLDATESKTSVDPAGHRALIQWVEEQRAQRGLPPRPENDDTPEKGLFERAKALGMVRPRRGDH